MDDRYAAMIFLGLGLTLPLSALIARRLPLRRTLRLVAIWALIIVGAALAIELIRGTTARHARTSDKTEETAVGEPAGVTATRIDILHNIYYQDV